MRVGIIGYGSMGKMLLWKFHGSGKVSKNELFAASRTAGKLDEVRDIAVICSNAEAARNSDVVFVCVRPSDMKTVLSDIAPFLDKDKLLVTLNGSIAFDMIKKIVCCRTAKVIPSVTAEISRSQTIVCYNDLAEPEDKDILASLLSCIGDVIELPEQEVGMGSELVSCMPGFIASIFDVVCTSAEGHTDIPRERIIRMVLNTMSATGDLMIQKDLSFDEVVSRVATKGGITEEGTGVIYDRFPSIAEELFDKTLSKRRLTAQRAADQFGGRQSIYLSDSCDVYYLDDRNVVLVHWKKYCELEQYRLPLEHALQVIKEHEGCNYVADTRDGFEDNPLDTRWVAEYFMPKAKEYGCRIIYFIIDKDNSLKDELEGQEKDSSDLLSFEYIYDIDEIV